MVNLMFHIWDMTLSNGQGINDGSGQLILVLVVND